MLIPQPKLLTGEVTRIFHGMNDDAIKKIILNDQILLKLASKLFMRRGHEKKEKSQAT